MKGFVIPEQGHVVNILPPVDANGGIVYSDVFSMKDAAHVDILISCGVNAAASTITVQECDDFTPTTPTAIAFNYRYSATDALGAKTAATSSGVTSGTVDNTMFIISIDAAELDAGYPNLRIAFSNPGAGFLVSAMAVLSGYRYQKDQNATEIA